MQIKCSSEDWTGVEEFWRSVVGLHDCLLSDVQLSDTSATLIVQFQEVLSYSPEGGFRPAYPSLELHLDGVENANFERARNCVGHDVIAAELLPSEFWISTMGGSFSVAFKAMIFKTL